MKREKALNKDLKKLNQLVEKRQFASAVKLLIKSGEDEGLIRNSKTDFEEFVSEGLIHGKAPNGLYSRLLELTCESYIEV
jgi:DnaJ family protein C protein 3